MPIHAGTDERVWFDPLASSIHAVVARRQCGKAGCSRSKRAMKPTHAGLHLGGRSVVDAVEGDHRIEEAVGMGNSAEIAAPEPRAKPLGPERALTGLDRAIR